MAAGDELVYPEPTGRDHLRALLESFAQFTPATAAGAVLMHDLIAPGLEKRRSDFFNEVAAGLARLNAEVREFDVRFAEHEDQFLTIAAKAGMAATRTVDVEKLERLRNAALNAALIDVDETHADMFMRAIDELSALHVRVLVYLSDPAFALKAAGLAPERFARGPRGAAFSAIFPKLGTRPIDLGGVILRDLYARGFLLTDEIDHLPHQQVMVTAPLTTELGLMFLAFIDPPWPGDT